MALINGQDYDHIDLNNGVNVVRHMIKDTVARTDITNINVQIGNIEDDIENQFNYLYDNLDASFDDIYSYMDSHQNTGSGGGTGSDLYDWILYRLQNNMFRNGEIINIPKTVSITADIGESTGIKSVDLEFDGLTVRDTLFEKIENNTYHMVYDGEDWLFEGNRVIPRNHGIEIIGLPQEGDEITFTQVSTVEQFVVGNVYYGSYLLNTHIQYNPEDIYWYVNGGESAAQLFTSVFPATNMELNAPEALIYAQYDIDPGTYSMEFYDPVLDDDYLFGFTLTQAKPAGAQAMLVLPEGMEPEDFEGTLQQLLQCSLNWYAHDSETLLENTPIYECEREAAK